MVASRADRSSNPSRSSSDQPGLENTARSTGMSMVVTFDNPEEQTLAVCLLPGHYEAGMTTAL